MSSRRLSKRGKSNKRKPKEQSQRERKKLVVAVLLSLGLVVAVITQPSDQSDVSAVPSINVDAQISSVSLGPEMSLGSQTPTGPATGTATNSEIPMTDDANKGLALIKRVELERIELEEMRELQLFRRSSKRTGVFRQRVQAVYGTARKSEALVEGRIVRDGQSLGSGSTVLEISDEGLRIKP